ncbi:hypothetical protein ACE1AT_20185 [Pelatocladus sp. BLCC-F211]|uniref:hypothetical protein n=1 Tax=Pelatocladus sp. BLCC-F211 TaxID=3342752 RepID=UPI0035BB198A
MFAPCLNQIFPLQSHRPERGWKLEIVSESVDDPTLYDRIAPKGDRCNYQLLMS